MLNKKFVSDGRRSSNGRAPEKSNFALACNLLSQYMKEKGSLKDLNFGGINGKLDAIGKFETSPAKPTTIDLLSSMEKRDQLSTHMEIDLFSQYSSIDSFSNNEDTTNKNSPSKTAQMTIFYKGQVLVFNDFSAEMAKEIVQVANNKGSSSSPNCFNSISDSTHRFDQGVGSASNSKENSPNCFNFTSNTTHKIDHVVELASNRKAVSEVRVHAELQVTGSYLPIARRASLQKFLEKRKERATLRAPYQLHNPMVPSSSKHEPKFDLNL